ALRTAIDVNDPHVLFLFPLRFLFLASPPVLGVPFLVCPPADLAEEPCSLAPSTPFLLLLFYSLERRRPLFLSSLALARTLAPVRYHGGRLTAGVCRITTPLTIATTIRTTPSSRRLNPSGGRGGRLPSRRACRHRRR
ncbi:unnamed protein product, partial [Ectocarpus sp. 12 AP-2014]